LFDCKCMLLIGIFMLSWQSDAAFRQNLLTLSDVKASSADKLDANADKLYNMDHALEASAVEIQGDTLVVQRGQK
jgi:hypothetical protein